MEDDEVEARDENVVKLSDSSMSSKQNSSTLLSLSESSEDQVDVGEYAVA